MKVLIVHEGLMLVGKLNFKLPSGCIAPELMETEVVNINCLVLINKIICNFTPKFNLSSEVPC